MKSISISIVFNVDVKQSLYRAAYDEAIEHAPSRLEDLWSHATLTSTTLIRPQYTITYSIVLA